MLRTFLAVLAVTAETAAIASFVILTSPFTRRFHDPAIRLWARGIVSACGIRVRPEGLEHLDPTARYVFVANHQSLLDIPCISLTLPNPVRYIAKRSLFRIPIFGSAMRAIGTVDIDRRNPDRAMRRIREAEVGVGQLCSLLFFAEGTRSRDGLLHPFKRGAFATALSLGVPIVPLAISGTRDILPKGHVAFCPGEVRLTVGRPIPVEHDGPEERERLRELAQAEVARLFESIGGAPAAGSAPIASAPSNQEPLP